MRHRKAGRKLGRSPSHRKAMLRNLATSLILEGSVETTIAKAKEIRSVVEKLITLARRNASSVVEAAGTTEAKLARVAAVRRAGRYVRGRDALQILFGELAERYQPKDKGGYTRITKLGNRLGDNAPLALIELINDQDAEEGDAEGEASA